MSEYTKSWDRSNIKESGLEQGGQLIEKWELVKGGVNTEKVRWSGD